MNPCTAVMQRSVRVGVLYPGHFVAIIFLGGYVCADLYNFTRRGLACVAYPYMGAMREPEYRDRRGGTNSHVFFVSRLKIISINAEFGSSGGSIKTSNVMKQTKKSEELQSRREFFKSAAKKVLPIIGAIAFGPQLLASCGGGNDDVGGCKDCSQVCASNCSSDCASECTNMCSDTCTSSSAQTSNQCSTCYNTCKGGCNDTCTQACSSGCGSGCSSGCTGKCTATCADSCKAQTQQGCSGCGQGCSSGCDTTCSTGCGGGCSRTCGGTCSSDCIGRCKSYCTSNSYTNTSWCAVCVFNCNSYCANTCSSYCYSSCSGNGKT